MSAVFSPCRTWRYVLARDLRDVIVPLTAKTERSFLNPRTVAFVGLNPSTADETKDDATVRRCVRFARRWGFERMVMLNIFAYRATNPRRLREATFETAVGPENDRHLYAQAAAANLVVCAWGTHGALWERGAEVEEFLREHRDELHVLGLTKDGHPKHPLYLRGDLEPVRWARA